MENGPFLSQIRHEQNALSFNSSLMHWKLFFSVMSSVVFCLQRVFEINFIWLKNVPASFNGTVRDVHINDFGNLIIWLLSFLYIWGAQGMSKSIRTAQVVAKAVLPRHHCLPWTHVLLSPQIAIFLGILSH